MLQTVTTMVSLLLLAGAAGLIAASLLEDKAVLLRALARSSAFDMPPLPPRTHRVAGARAARFIRMVPAPQLRAAA